MKISMCKYWRWFREDLKNTGFLLIPYLLYLTYDWIGQRIGTIAFAPAPILCNRDGIIVVGGGRSGGRYAHCSLKFAIGIVYLEVYVQTKEPVGLRVWASRSRDLPRYVICEHHSIRSQANPKALTNLSVGT